MERIEIIKLSFGIAGLKTPDGKWLIPPHLKGTLHCDIADNVAVFYSIPDSRIAEIIARTEIKHQKDKGYQDTFWLVRESKAITKYEGKTKERIRDIILSELKQMGLKANA